MLTRPERVRGRPIQPASGLSFICWLVKTGTETTGAYFVAATYAAAFFARFVSASRFAAEAFTRSNLDLGGVMALGLLEGMLTHSQELSLGL